MGRDSRPSFLFRFRAQAFERHLLALSGALARRELAVGIGTARIITVTVRQLLRSAAKALPRPHVLWDH